jgi:ABC-type multidrug transport system fused ATPase/permease subunit
MLSALKASLGFMTPKERAKWISLTALRSLLAILDVAGVLAIGFVVTSTAIFLTEGSRPDRVLEFGGLQIPAVTAQTLPWVGLGILAMFVVKAVLSIRIIMVTAHFVAKIEARAARVIATNVFGAGLEKARLRSREEMSFAVQFGSPAAFNGVLNSTSTLIAEGSLFILICVGFLTVDLAATVSAMLYFGFIGFVLHYFIGTLMQRAGAQATDSTISANNAIGDLIAVFREISVLGLRKKYIERIYNSRISAAESVAKQIYLNGMPRYIIETALLVGVAAFILSQALTGDIVSAAGTVGVFLAGGLRVTAAMLPLQSALLSISAIIPMAAKAHEILLESDSRNLIDPSSPTENRRISSPKQSSPVGVKFAEVSFTFPGAESPALLNLDFEIQPGQQVAFIGPSGAGKSTIADLMCGLLTPTKGSVGLIKGVGLPVSQSLTSVSYVPQKPGLVSGSIAENVALGIEPEYIDEKRVWEAIERAHLHSVVESLPSGIRANLGNYQDGLSGGQIQRLGLARALYSQPGLLVMDEATSALDAESESEVAKALDEMRGKVTVVLIAHRLNTVQRSDRVFLIEGGLIVDSGTFQELRHKNPSIERQLRLMKVEKE